MPIRNTPAALVLVLSAFLATAARAQDSAITGSITMHGCAARPNDFVLKARPAGDGRGVLNADVQAVPGNPQQFTFTVGPVPAGTTHLLDLQFNEHCGRVFFHGPPQGLVTAGETVNLDGYAARTRIEVLGEAHGHERPERRWLGADAFDFTNPAESIRKLRVQTDLSNVSKFLVQFATERFPIRGPQAVRACLDDGPSVVRTLEFNAATVPPEMMRVNPNPPRAEWVELPPIDFNALLLGTSHPSLVGTVAPMDPGILKMLSAGAPLYVRAIPETVSATGALVRRCDPDQDGIPGVTMLARLLEALDASEVSNPPFPLRLHSAEYVGPTIQPWPNVGDELCLRAVDDHPLELSKLEACFNPLIGTCADKWGWQFVLYKPFYKIGTTVPKGGHVCVPHSSGGGNFLTNMLSGFGDAITGFVDTIGGLVKDAGKLWDAIKAKVVEIAADVITTVGVPCDTTCQGLLELGLNLALASAGVPPELPDLDALKGDLREYVAAEIADQVAPGVPGSQVLAEKALEYAENAISKYAAGGSGGGNGDLPPWVTLDVGLEPAVLRLTLEHVQATPPPPIELLPPDTKLMVDRNSIYARSWIDLPRQFFTGKIIIPGFPFRDLLKVPIVLKPNLSAVPKSPYQSTCESVFKGSNLSKCLDNSAYGIAVWNKRFWAQGIDDSSCVPFAQTWWAFTGPFSSAPLGFIAYLTTPVLTHATYNPELPTPAVIKFCTP
jgi:hypothetical protein